ncbi:GNAT family N-acetyltransferase [Devosia lacusdianchii]|uniref:GNAT family N-acetyltransferase n=1 Tax=Devosia lacusdianchii TaxID=2917991 RepID=UPI001F06956B|nr:GNAT family N-acetyltransferase [Devosia sp. JXJ CY 41]
MTISTALLIDHKDAIEPLSALFESEWPDWYNARGASARTDLSERMRRDGLPLGIVALQDGVVVGTCALTASSGGLVTERSPWVGGLVVMPQVRRRGVAKALLGRAKAEALRLGHRRLYALTADAVHLFEQQGWTAADVILMSGEPHRIFVINS